MSFVLVIKDRKEPGSLSTRQASVFSHTIQHICKCHLFSLYHSVGVGVQKTDSKIKCVFFSLRGNKDFPQRNLPPQRSGDYHGKFCQHLKSFFYTKAL